jgi:hypothetical protein
VIISERFRECSFLCWWIGWHADWHGWQPLTELRDAAANEDRSRRACTGRLSTRASGTNS